MRASAALLVAFATACATSADSARVAGGLWETRTPVPEPRTEVSVAADDSLVYLLGGFGPGPRRRARAPRAMLTYDPRADRWDAAGDIPEGVNHAGLAAVGGRLYLIGGFREHTFAPTGAVRIYDPSTAAWRDGAPMLTARGALAVAVLDGKIHAIGGTAESGAGRSSHEHGTRREDNSVGTHEVYDPATDAWTRRAPMPTPRNHLGAAVANGRIHAVGGRVGGEMELTTHEIYDQTSGTWSPGPPLPTGRSGIAVVTHRGMIYVFGGETVRLFRRSTFDAAERYDPADERWDRLDPMPTARHGLGAASLGGTIHVLSGGPRAGMSFGMANERLVVKPPS